MIDPLRSGKRVLVMDDDQAARSLTTAVVEALGHQPETARDPIDALAKLRLGVDLVLLDVEISGTDGYEVCRRIRQDAAGEHVPVILVTATSGREERIRGIEVGASDFIGKPVDKSELHVRSASLFRLKEAQDALLGHQNRLEALVEERTASLRTALEQLAQAQRVAYLAQLDTVERLAILAEYKDQVTARHIRRMSEYCAVIARGLNLPALEVELILHASRMHDVGKIAVPDSILQKPSTLDAPEWAVMRRHAMIGSRILDNSSSALLQAGRVIALCHHERWDGSGYPNGTAGEEIPLWARICAVADVFDAVTSERPYKPAYSIEEALNILRNGRGTQFDPQIVDVFFDQLDEILEIVAVYCEPDEPID